MNFDPPIIENIEQVLPVIKDNSAFICVNKGWYTVIDYVWNSADSFKNPIARECRGLKFRSDTGALIARPYHKFHNLGETEEYSTKNVDLSLPHMVLDKLDGSMVHTVLNPHDDSLYLMTRMGFTNVAEDALSWLVSKGPIDTVLDLVHSHPYLTFIFEYVGPKNKIVIDYPEENMILTGIRNTRTGYYVPYNSLHAIAKRYYGGVDVVQAYDYFLDTGKIAADEEKEGAVVRFETGAMVKVKSEIYVRKHRSKELTETHKGVVQLIIDGKLDDVKPQLDTALVKKLEDYQQYLFECMAALSLQVDTIVKVYEPYSQKEFALRIQDAMPKYMHPILFTVRKGDKAWDTVTKRIVTVYNDTAKLDKLFEDCGWNKWK